MSEKINIFGVGDLAAEMTAKARGQAINENPNILLGNILANVSKLAGQSAAVLAVVAVTFSLDTSIYASGDVLADTQAIAGAVRTDAGTGKVESIVLIDKDDNAAADIDVVFLKSNTALGAENGAPSISDANSVEILGVVTLASALFLDFGGAKIATKVLDQPLPIKAESGTSIYVALITRGTPTQTAAGIVGTFTIRQD